MNHQHRFETRRSPRAGWISLAVLMLLVAATSGNGRRFYDDDPLAREPETQDASPVKPWDISLTADLTTHLFSDPGQPGPSPRAQNVNTIDEVPDSSWFTNRIGTRAVTLDEIRRGPATSEGPAAGTWTIVGSKREGVTPGFTIRDSAGARWFIEFDPPSYPEAPSGAEMVATKIFWTLGYNQAENHLAEMRPDQLVMGEGTNIRPPSGRRRPMTMKDVDKILGRAASKGDGTYRVFASRALDGQPLGGFRYHGTRPDDPNDVVPHEHRRELRALRVFGAWTNLVDMKAGNTLDVLVKENGRSIVKHYLLDVGSGFGTGGIAPHGYEEGHAYIVDLDTTLPTLLSLGFNIRPWLTIPYEKNRAIGRYSGAGFEPDEWKPRTANAAYLRARADDKFWAARRVMAFTDEMLRSIAVAGRYSDATAEKLLADVLIQRRNRIGETYLNAVNPLVDFALDASGNLTFQNAAVQANVAKPPSGYRATWSRFDNLTGQTTPVGAETTGTDLQLRAPDGLPAATGDYIRVDVSAAAGSPHQSWTKPVHVYFKRAASAWTLVGLDRLPD